jgi:hypothetical protein
LEEESLGQFGAWSGDSFDSYGDGREKMNRALISDSLSDSNRLISCHTAPVPLATAKSGSSAMIRAIPGSDNDTLQSANHKTSTGEHSSAIGSMAR